MPQLEPIAPDPHSLERLRELVDSTLDLGRREGADAAEAEATCTGGLSVNVRLGEVETIEHTRDKSLEVTVYLDQRKGSASTSDFSPGAVHDTVRAACNIARHASRDPHAGLADPARMADAVPDLDLYHPWSLEPQAAIDLGLEAETTAREADSRISNSEGAGVSRHDSIFVYGNSHGFVGGYPSSRHSLGCCVIAGSGDGMQRDAWYSRARSAGELETPREVGAKAAKRAVARLDSQKLSTRRTPVVYAAEMARGLFQHLVAAVRGASQYRKASFLLDHAGKSVFRDFMHIHEQPHLRGALGSAAFDNEGVATTPRDLVRDGVLQGYVLDSYSARRLGLETTGNAGGVHNLTVSPNAGDLDALLHEMGSGLLITELMGFGINGVTGDYSRGASGFWIEDGTAAFPVEEITVAGNLREMFEGITHVGSDLDLRGNVRCGSVLIESMTVAGA
jgi:PmbA protein